MRPFLGAVAFLVLFVSSAGAVAGLVQPVNGSSQIVVLAAASAAGANGTFFRSDITIVNLGTRPQTIELRWLPQAGTSETVTKTITMPATGAGYILRSSDFVRDYLGQTGLGSILITGVDSTGARDTAARLYVAARVWTPQPGTAGTTSQSFPTLPMSAIHTVGPVFLPGMGLPSNTGTFRTNLGIVNLDRSNTQTFRISWTFPGLPDKPAIFTVAVAPMSMIQGGLAPLELGVAIENITSPETRSTLWTAYGSTVDNITGDAWSELALDVSQ